MSLAGSARVTINATALTGVSGLRISRREQTMSLGRDGNIHTFYHTIMRTAPRIDFQTLDIGVLLGLLTQADYPSMALSAAIGLTAVMPQQNTAAPDLASGSVHTQYRLAGAANLHGSVFLERLSWSNGQAVQAAVSAFGMCTNGTADPLAPSQVAVPAQQGGGAAWAVTACTVDGVALTDVESVEITIDHKAENNGGMSYLNGLPHPVRLSFGSAGVISARITCGEIFTALGDRTGPVVITLTQKTENSPVMSGTTLTLTLNAAMIYDEISDGDPSMRTITAMAAHDGTNRPFTVS